MPLNPGSRLGPYEILAAIGAGGMGEVYRAKDTRLDRPVAIKVLASHLTSSPELKQRFDREARAISSLSHPHICTLHDVGHQDGVDFLVMEYLEGESLAQRLARGPMPIEQVLKFGVEIAGALDVAHKQGIVHRDLKPGNVVLTKSGAKILDFGLAKMAAGTPAGQAPADVTSLPTEAIGSQPLTTEGTLLGTFQYMAPEQLEGTEADSRTDIFAFGALLYEMATGKPAFAGKSRASLISAIMSSQPASISSFEPLTPPALEKLVRTCLAKDPDDRWQTAHDVALQLQWIAEGGSQVGLPAPVSARRVRREQIAWALATLAVIAAGVFAVRDFTRTAGSVAPTRFTVPAPSGVVSLGLPRISPDGRTLAFNATDSTGKAAIWIRPLSALEAAPLAGTEGAGRPFWSPDSRMIGFVADGKMKKIPVAGGPAEILCPAPGADGSWSARDMILFDAGDDTTAIHSVPAAGGVPRVELANDSTNNFGWPTFLPDGRHYLILGGPLGRYQLGLGTLGSRVIKRLGATASRVEYSREGYVMFVRERTLMAQRFDERKLELVGDPFPVAEPLAASSFGLANFSVSDNGTLVYRNSLVTTSRLVWMERSGRELETLAAPADYRAPAISPDGRRIAMRRRDPQSSNLDIWILEPARGAFTRFTFDPKQDGNPLWSPDGSRIVFSSDRDGAGTNIYVKATNGLGEEEALVRSPNGKWPDSWSPDGRYLIYNEFDPKTNSDLWVIPMSGDHTPKLFLRTPFAETQAQFSPDGKWVAYGSDESDRPEIYVVPFEGSAGKTQVSTAGGTEPHWRGDGKELYFISPDQKLMAVDVKPGAILEVGIPHPLFQVRVQAGSRNTFCVTPDGQRFLLVRPDDEALAPNTVVLDWSAGVKRK